jgi:hypothetical protein
MDSSTNTLDDAKFSSICSQIDEVITKMGFLGTHSTPRRKPTLDPDEHSFNTTLTPDKNRYEAIQSSEEDEDDGFTTVTRKRATETSKIGTHRIYTEEECKEFSKLYNDWFQCYTGKFPGFIITPESQPYISSFEACLELHHALITLFDERPSWVDPFGGSGLDTCAAMFGMNLRSVHVSEFYHTHDKEEAVTQYVTMEENIHRLLQDFPQLDSTKNTSATKVFMYNKKSEDFLRHLPINLKIDILYLDPNWYKGGPQNETERSPAEMVNYLRYHVIKPLKETNRLPKCIVLKTRWLSEVLWPFIKVLTPDYHPRYSIEATPFRTRIDENSFLNEGEVRGRFHWAVIIHDELKTIHWHKSQVYKDIFIHRKDVYIDEADLIGPGIPLYSGRTRYPQPSSKTEPGPGVIHVRPPPRVKKTGDFKKKVKELSKYKRGRNPRP